MKIYERVTEVSITALVDYDEMDWLRNRMRSNVPVSLPEADGVYIITSLSIVEAAAEDGFLVSFTAASRPTTVAPDATRR